MKNINGKGASKGKYSGKACLVESINDFAKVHMGDIIIVHSSSPAWTVPMLQAGALVSELGGIISHTAIVAREMGIPCIVGAKGVFDVVKDGDLLEIDGETGDIYVK